MLSVHHIPPGGPLFPGGAEKYTLAVVSALLDSGVSIHVGFSGDSIYNDLLDRGGGADRSVEPRLTVERTGWIDASISGDARLAWRTILNRRAWLRSTGADTVFAVQQGGGGAFAASLVAARMLGMRVVASVRQLPSALPSSSGKRWAGVVPSPELWRRRLIWRRRIPAWCCNAIIFNSRRVADAHAAAYRHPRHRERIIFNGEAEQSPVMQASQRPMRIASVGRVTEAKGSDTLLEAFGRIASRHPDAGLTYYGDGPLVPILRDKAKAMGLGDRVKFAGHRADREDIYPHVDICVQPSRRESMSNSVVEAMARGIPCVVSDVGGMPETVADGECGFVVPPAAVDPCAEAISRLLSDRSTYGQFSEASLRRARTLFSLDRVMAETIDTVLGVALEAI